MVVKETYGNSVQNETILKVSQTNYKQQHLEQVACYAILAISIIKVIQSYHTLPCKWEMKMISNIILQV